MRKIFLILLLNLLIFSCVDLRFELKNTIAESEEFTMYFESDTINKIIYKDYIGGKSIPIYKTDSTVYFNYNQSLEEIFNYEKKDDSLILTNSKTNLRFVIKESSKENIFAFDRLYNEHKRLGIPPDVFYVADFKDLNAEEVKKIISKIWRKTVSKYKYPKSVELDYFYVQNNQPKNKMEIEWNNESLFDDYRFSLSVKAQNFLKQKNTAHQTGYIVIEKGKSDEIIFDFAGKKNDEYKWREYDIPDNFSEDDVISINTILKNQYNIDVKEDVYELSLTDYSLKEKGYYDLTLDIKIKPDNFYYKYFKTDSKYFKLYKEEKSIKIETDL